MTTTATDLEKKPFHLRGNYAPVQDEIEAFDLEVEGAIPPEIDGHLLRNGPNPKSGESPHWFFGDGMLHSTEISGGKAKVYRNRYVRTKQFLEDAQTINTETGEFDITVAAANTPVMPHAGKVFALVESSLPTEVTCTGETVGTYDFGGKLATAMTAHPKVCGTTGELHFFGYSYAEPYLVYHATDAQGRLVKTEEIKVPGPTMMHDFVITKDNVIFMDLPICFDLERAMRGTMPYAWSDDYGARVGIMPRGGTSDDVRWFEVDPCYVFHPLNAYDEGDKTVVDVARYKELWRGDPGEFDPAMMHRWEFNRATGAVSESPIDDRATEFPRIDERLTGLKHRYGYSVWTPEGVDGGEARGIIKYDVESGTSEVHDLGPGRRPSEAVFVPADPNAAEDEGYVLFYVHNEGTDKSEVAVVDAQNMSGAAVATIKLPQRVPYGLHGCWVGRS